jgi:hypothetical protein
MTRRKFPVRLTATYSDLMRSLRTDWGSDHYGNAMGALFPVCEELYCRLYVEETLKDPLDDAVQAFLEVNRFRPSPMSLADFRRYLDREADLYGGQDGGNFWAQEVRAAKSADLLKFGRLLSRVVDILKAMHEDY